jgi:hypothetical protein
MGSLYSNESLIGYKPDDGTSVSPTYNDRIKRLATFEDDFFGDAGQAEPPPWVHDVNGTAGTPTVDYVSGEGAGVLRIALTTNSERQDAYLSFGNNLLINMSKKPVLHMRLRLNPDASAAATLSADERLVFGFASSITNSEDDVDAVATNCWFRIGDGADNNIYVETDDATTDYDYDAADGAADTGVDYTTDAFHDYKIDCSDLSDIKFFIDDELVEVVSSTTSQIKKYSMAGLPADTYVQVLVCLQRVLGAEDHQVDIDYIKVEVER